MALPKTLLFFFSFGDSWLFEAGEEEAVPISIAVIARLGWVVLWALDAFCVAGYTS